MSALLFLFCLLCNVSAIVDTDGAPDDSAPVSSIVYGLLLVYTIVIIIIGLLGNSFVIFATLKYSTFGIEHVAVIFIRHLCICDVLFILCIVVPDCVFYIKGWLLGVAGCYYNMYVDRCLNSANFKFICIISVHRLVRCIKPQMAGNLTNLHAHAICGTAWGLSLVELVLIGLGNSKVGYELGDIKGTIQCKSYHILTDIEKVLKITHFFIVLVIPFCITLLSSIILWVFVLLRSEKFNYRSITTTSIISTLVVIAWMPIVKDMKTVFTSNIGGTYPLFSHF